MSHFVKHFPREKRRNAIALSSTNVSITKTRKKCHPNITLTAIQKLIINRFTFCKVRLISIITAAQRDEKTPVINSDLSVANLVTSRNSWRASSEEQHS